MGRDEKVYPILLDDLSEEGTYRRFETLAANAGVPTPESEAYFAARREKGLGVGMVDSKLMRALHGGRVEEILLEKKSIQDADEGL